MVHFEPILDRARMRHAKLYGRRHKVKASYLTENAKRIPGAPRYPRRFIRVLDPETKAMTDWDFSRGILKLIAQSDPTETPVSKEAIRKKIFLSGLGGRYKVNTGGLRALPEIIPTSCMETGNAIVRALRRIATKHPGDLT